MDEVPNGGMRDSDNEDSDSHSSKDEEISYGNNDLNDNTGVRNEVSYPMNNNNNVYDNDYQDMDNYGHMNTDQQIAVAEKLNIAQADHDQQMDEYRKEIEQLKGELKESHGMNEQLMGQNDTLEIEKNRYAEQASFFFLIFLIDI